MHLTAVEVYPLAGKLLTVLVNGEFHW